ncbi:MAG: VOC family protein [Bacteroidia bacterium]|nr:VOC family protein [Bacteroidia bacterium]
MRFQQIKETCIYFHDLKKAKDFYHNLLELPIISYVPGKHIFFRTGSSVLLCFNPNDSRKKQSPPPHAVEGKYHFALEVTPKEYETHKQEIQNKGITIIDKVIWETGQESFYFEDPAGNVLEIVPEGIRDKPNS